MWGPVSGSRYRFLWFLAKSHGSLVSDGSPFDILSNAIGKSTQVLKTEIPRVLQRCDDCAQMRMVIVIFGAAC